MNKIDNNIYTNNFLSYFFGLHFSFNGAFCSTLVGKKDAGRLNWKNRKRWNFLVLAGRGN